MTTQTASRKRFIYRASEGGGYHVWDRHRKTATSLPMSRSLARKERDRQQAIYEYEQGHQS